MCKMNKNDGIIKASAPSRCLPDSLSAAGSASVCFQNPGAGSERHAVIGKRNALRQCRAHPPLKLPLRAHIAAEVNHQRKI